MGTKAKPSARRTTGGFAVSEKSERDLVIGEFVEHDNNGRYLDNLTPAAVYFGRAPAILKRREAIKRKTIEQRRLACVGRQSQPEPSNQMSQRLFKCQTECPNCSDDIQSQKLLRWS
jgi:hypothetical protein